MLLSKDIENCLQTLSSGGVILYPTDTVWGIGCDATNNEAVGKIFDIKHRPDSKSFVILVKDIDAIQEYADMPSSAMLDYALNSIKPVTFVLKNAKNLAPSTISGDGTVAIRIPKDEFCGELLALYGKPIVSTSANISGQPTPRLYTEIHSAIRESMDYIVRFRRDDIEPSSSSTIISMEVNGDIKIIRP